MTLEQPTTGRTKLTRMLEESTQRAQDLNSARDALTSLLSEFTQANLQGSSTPSILSISDTKRAARCLAQSALLREKLL